MVRSALGLVLLAGVAFGFPNGMPFCVLRPEVQTTWAEQIGTTQLSFNQTCYRPGDEIIVSLDAVRGADFHGFVIRSDAGHFVRRHGFGGYRWIGDEANPDQSCITHIFPGPREENGKRLKKSLKAKLVVPNRGRLTPIRIIVEATAIKSFDDDVWTREWQSGVYSITRGTIEICPRRPSPRAPAPRRPQVAALKRSRNTGKKAARKPKAVAKISAPAGRKPSIKFDPHKRCLQKSDAGRCPGVQNPDWVQPYYYDTDAKICRRFFYAGCGGNTNRFATLAECERWCTGGDQPCAKKQNVACGEGVRYSWQPAYFLDDTTSQCVHYWYRSCGDSDLPLFTAEKECRRQCLGEEEKKSNEPSFGPKGRCFELFDRNEEMCPVWATKKICSPYPEDHQNHWAHHHCRLSCCVKHAL